MNLTITPRRHPQGADDVIIIVIENGHGNTNLNAG